MKKNIILILIFITPFCLSQHYSFNILTKYKSENGFYKESVVYSNKANDKYFLKIKKYKNRTIASLIDLDKSKKHSFKVTEIRNNYNEVFFKFTYEESSDYNLDEPLKGYHLVFDVIKKDSLSKTVRMDLVNKRGKVVGKSELKFKHYEHNLFPVFRYSCLHPFELSKNENFKGKGLVERYKRVNKDNTITIYYLDYFKEVNLELSIK